MVVSQVSPQWRRGCLFVPYLVFVHHLFLCDFDIEFWFVSLEDFEQVLAGQIVGELGCISNSSEYFIGGVGGRPEANFIVEVRAYQWGVFSLSKMAHIATENIEFN